MKVSPWTVQIRETTEFVLEMNTAAIIRDNLEYIDTSKSISFSYLKGK